MLLVFNTNKTDSRPVLNFVDLMQILNFIKHILVGSILVAFEKNKNLAKKITKVENNMTKFVRLL